MPNICIICHKTSRKFKDINFIPFPKKFEIREKWLKFLKLCNGPGIYTGVTGRGVVLAIFYVFYPIFLRSRRETFVSPHYYFAWPIMIYLRNEFSLKRAHADRGSIITMLCAEQKMATAEAILANFQKYCFWWS